MKKTLFLLFAGFGINAAIAQTNTPTPDNGTSGTMNPGTVQTPGSSQTNPNSQNPDHGSHNKSGHRAATQDGSQTGGTYSTTPSTGTRPKKSNGSGATTPNTPHQ